MSNTEYQQKQDAIKASSASSEVRAKALEELELKYKGVDQRNENLLKEIYNGQAELRTGEI